VIGKHERQKRQALHVFEGTLRMRLLTPRGIHGPRFIGVELALDVVQHRRFALAVRDDERVMIHCRHVELHAVELQHLGNHFARCFELGIRAREIQLRVIRAAVIGRDHPRQSVHSCAVRVNRRRVTAVDADERFRRRLGRVPAGAPMAVDVGIAREPLPFRLHRGQHGPPCGRNGDDKQNKPVAFHIRTPV
jgi:hypothetical protein